MTFTEYLTKRGWTALAVSLLLVSSLLLISCGGSGGSGGSSGGDVTNDTVVESDQPMFLISEVAARNTADGNISLTWKNPNDIVPGIVPVNFRIYWSTDGLLSEYRTWKHIDLSEPPFVHENLTPATTYYYTVTSVLGARESDAYRYDYATAGAPLQSNNIKTNPSGANIEVSWDPVTSANSYTVYWMNSLGESDIEEFASSPFMHLNLSGVQYRYSVSATNGNGEGKQTAEIIQFPAIPPETPSDFRVFVSHWIELTPLCEVPYNGIFCETGKDLRFSWNNIGAHYYTIYHATGESIGSSYDSDYFRRYRVNFPLSYCYYLIAKNDYGSSPPTEVVCG